MSEHVSNFSYDNDDLAESLEDRYYRERQEHIRAEKRDAADEYLETMRGLPTSSSEYRLEEPWAWVKLRQRIRSINDRAHQWGIVD